MIQERKLETYLFFILLAFALYLVFQLFAPYIQALAVALIFAVVFHPLHTRILRLMPRHKALAALATLIIIVVVVLMPLVFYGVQLSDEVKNFYDYAFVEMQGDGLMTKLTAAGNNIIQSFSPFGVKWPVFSATETEVYVFNILSWLRGHFGDIFSGLAKVFINLFIFLVALYYFLKDGDKARHAVVVISPFNDSRDHEILERLRTAVVSVVKGSILVAIIQGFVAGLGYTIFAVPSAFLWAGIAAIAALIPGVGTGLVNLPAILYLFFTGHTPQAIGMTLWAMFAVGFIDNILGPKFAEKGLKIHPFLILLSVLGGIVYFGPIGFVFGPIILAFLFALFDIYKTIIVKDHTAH